MLIYVNKYILIFEDIKFDHFLIQKQKTLENHLIFKGSVLFLVVPPVSHYYVDYLKKNINFGI